MTSWVFLCPIGKRRTKTVAARGKRTFSTCEKINELNDFLDQRAESQIIATLNAESDDKESIFNNYFAERPKLTKGTLPSASDFGRMRPKDKLQYLTSSSAVIDAMNL